MSILSRAIRIFREADRWAKEEESRRKLFAELARSPFYIAACSGVHVVPTDGSKSWPAKLQKKYDEAMSRDSETLPAPPRNAGDAQDSDND